jgi:hypothetical protein
MGLKKLLTFWLGHFHNKDRQDCFPLYDDSDVDSGVLYADILRCNLDSHIETREHYRQEATWRMFASGYWTPQLCHQIAKKNNRDLYSEVLEGNQVKGGKRA